jgi:hypothetical protein
MDIEEALTKAVDATCHRDPELPQQLLVPAFQEVLRHLLQAPSKAVVPFSVPEPAPTTGLARLAARTKVSEQALGDIFDVDGDSISVHVASSRINSAKSRATRDIALLVVAARQGAGLDESWTAIGHVREALQNYNRYDASNFSSYLKASGDAFNVRGKGVSMELRLTQPGWEAATALIASLISTTN